MDSGDEDPCASFGRIQPPDRLKVDALWKALKGSLWNPPERFLDFKTNLGGTKAHDTGCNTIVAMNSLPGTAYPII